MSSARLAVGIIVLGWCLAARGQQLPPQATTPTTVPAPTAQPASEKPTEDDAKAAPVVPEYSFGNAPFSLLFTAEQAQAMRSVLKAAEDQKRAAIATGATPATASPDASLSAFIGQAPGLIEEPIAYPVFYLSSVMYRDANDWSVWIGNRRISAQDNTGELSVTSVSNDAASFRWKPAYSAALTRRFQEKKFLPVDTVKHRATRTNTASFNAVEQFVTFTLKPNQSFSAGHLATFEGQVRPAAVPSMVAVIPGVDGGSAADSVTGQAVSTAGEAALLNDLAGGAASSPGVAAGAVNALNDVLKAQSQAQATVVKPGEPHGGPPPSPAAP